MKMAKSLLARRLILLALVCGTGMVGAKDGKQLAFSAATAWDAATGEPANGNSNFMIAVRDGNRTYVQQALNSLDRETSESALQKLTMTNNKGLSILHFAARDLAHSAGSNEDAEAIMTMLVSKLQTVFAATGREIANFIEAKTTGGGSNTASNLATNNRAGAGNAHNADFAELSPAEQQGITARYDKIIRMLADAKNTNSSHPHQTIAHIAEGDWQQDDAGNTALHRAAKTGNLAEVKRMLSLPSCDLAMLTLPNNNELTALQLAARDAAHAVTKARQGTGRRRAAASQVVANQGDAGKIVQLLLAKLAACCLAENEDFKKHLEYTKTRGNGSAGKSAHEMAKRNHEGNESSAHFSDVLGNEDMVAEYGLVVAELDKAAEAALAIPETAEANRRLQQLAAGAHAAPAQAASSEAAPAESDEALTESTLQKAIRNGRRQEVRAQLAEIAAQAGDAGLTLLITGKSAPLTLARTRYETTQDSKSRVILQSVLNKVADFADKLAEQATQEAEALIDEE